MLKNSKNQDEKPNKGSEDLYFLLFILYKN